MAQHSLDPEKRVNSKLFKPLVINPNHLYWNPLYRTQWVFLFKHGRPEREILAKSRYVITDSRDLQTFFSSSSSTTTTSANNSRMEWLPAATRQLLPKKDLCSSCFTHYRSLSKARPFLTSPLRRYYAFTPSCRRMAAREHTTEADIDEEPQQAYPLSGYYYDILSTKSPYRRQARTSRPVPTQNEQSTPATTVEPQSPQDKMSIVFGTRLASPGRSSRYDPGTVPPESTWKTINGVAIPPRPSEPDNCCMSGCAHCVWDDFRDDMEEWAGRIDQAKAKATSTPSADMRQSSRAEVASASMSMDDDGGGSDTNWPQVDQSEDIFANIPVGIREFMKTEKKLKQRHQQAATA